MKEYKKHMVEAAFVVFGVVLALIANEWRRSVADKRYAQSARKSIITELAANKSAVDAAAAYHGELSVAIRQHLGQNPQEPLNVRTFPKGFIHPADTFSTAWEAAKNTGALRHMSYEDVLRFSKIYALQSRYEHQQEMAGSVIYERMADGGIGEVLHNPNGLSSIIVGMTFKEKELSAAYAQVLKEMKKP